MYYRKYRSQTIAEIDNTEIRETLGKALLENKFSQAYLLVGTRGSGKTSMARLIAKVVNCTERKLGEEPCNKCDSCLAIAEGRALDVVEIDAASNTGVDDIRDLREKVKLAPVQGKFKIYIIDEVHMLSTSAFNALLKTLEEPPTHVIFVLATTDPQKLPETIISRCLVYDFKTASKEELLRSLARVVEGEKIVVEEGVLEKVAELGKGSFRDAQKILEQLAMKGGKISLEQTAEGSSDSTRDVALTILGAVSDRDEKLVLETVEKFSSAEGRVEMLVEEILKVLRDFLLAKKGVTTEKFTLNFSDQDVNRLVLGCVAAATTIRDCPVPQLPLEAMMVSFLNEQNDLGSVSQKQSQLKVVKEEPKNLKEESEPAVEEVHDVVEEKRNIEVKPVPEQKETEKPPQKSYSGPPVDGLTIETVIAKWPEILVDLKPHNHSLVAFLRACRPKEVLGDILVVEVFYKFHRDKLSETRNREIFEDVVSKIFDGKVRAKFDLSEKKPE